MMHELNIFRGSLTNYQLSEALDLPIELIEGILKGVVSPEELCPDVIDKIHHLERALFGHVKNN